MPENREPQNITTPTGAADLERKLGELFTSPRGEQAKPVDRAAVALLADSSTERPRAPSPSPVTHSPDDRLEAAFWRFDTLRGGQLRQSDRDAFKGAVRAYLAGTLEGDIAAPPPPADESAGAMLARLGMDGMLWAREFVGQYGGDVGLMIAWFANAIMAGYDRGTADGAKGARAALLEPFTIGQPGEPPNTISRMEAAIEAAAVEVGPAAAQRLRAAWVEVGELRHGTARLLDRMTSERNAWIDRAAGLYYVIDRIDDHAEMLDPSRPADDINHQITRSKVIVFTDGGGREVWGDPPTLRTVDGAPIWWPDDGAPVAAEVQRSRLTGRPTAVQHSLVGEDGELARDVVGGRLRYNEDGTATVLVGEAETPTTARPGDWIVRDYRGLLFVLADTPRA